MGYTPFWVSARYVTRAAPSPSPSPSASLTFLIWQAGQIEGELDAARAAAKGVGAQRHSCWTYWGHVSWRESQTRALHPFAPPPRTPRAARTRRPHAKTIDPSVPLAVGLSDPGSLHVTLAATKDEAAARAHYL